MNTKRVFAVLAVLASAVVLGAPAGAAAQPSCAGQVAGNQDPPGIAGDFNSFFGRLAPGWGQTVSAYAQADRGACPPLAPG